SSDLATVILDGLSRLEYRGYDSAGLVVRDHESGGNRLSSVKRAGKLQVLKDAVAGDAPLGGLGLGHTRWATHGRPNHVNAHPHLTEDGRLAVIHNGIIENYVQLKERLRASGHEFASETDTEVLAHLIEETYAVSGGDLARAVREALAQVEGAYALV